MQYSLETRVPLLDYRVVEFALNLSDKLKMYYSGSMKYLLKEVLYVLCTKQWLKGPKWGFGIPLKMAENGFKMDDWQVLFKEVVESAGAIKYEIVRIWCAVIKAEGQTTLYNRSNTRPVIRT